MHLTQAGFEPVILHPQPPTELELQMWVTMSDKFSVLNTCMVGLAYPTLWVPEEPYCHTAKAKDTGPQCKI